MHLNKKQKDWLSRFLHVKFTDSSASPVAEELAIPDKKLISELRKLARQVGKASRVTGKEIEEDLEKVISQEMLKSKDTTKINGELKALLLICKEKEESAKLRKKNIDDLVKKALDPKKDNLEDWYFDGKSEYGSNTLGARQDITDKLTIATESTISGLQNDAKTDEELGNLLLVDESNKEMSAEAKKLLEKEANELLERAKKKKQDFKENNGLVPELEEMLLILERKMDRDDLPTLLTKTYPDLRKEFEVLTKWPLSMTIKEAYDKTKNFRERVEKEIIHYNELKKADSSIEAGLEKARKDLDELLKQIGRRDDNILKRAVGKGDKLKGALPQKLDNLEVSYKKTPEESSSKTLQQLAATQKEITEFLKEMKNFKAGKNKSEGLENIIKDHDTALEDEKKLKNGIKKVTDAIEELEKKLEQERKDAKKDKKAYEDVKERLQAANKVAKAGDIATAEVLMMMAEKAAKDARETDKKVSLEKISDNWGKALEHFQTKLIGESEGSILWASQKGLGIHPDDIAALKTKLEALVKEAGNPKDFEAELKVLNNSDSDKKKKRAAREKARAKVQSKLALFEKDPRFIQLTNNGLGVAGVATHVVAMLRKYDYLFSTAVSSKKGIE